MSDTLLVYHPGHASQPVTALSRGRAIQWTRPVFEVPRSDGVALVHQCGLCEAVRPADLAARLGLTKAAAKRLAKDANVAEHAPPGGSPETVIILDGVTQALLAELRGAAATEAAEEPAEDQGGN